MFDLKEIKTQIDLSLKHGYISSNILLGKSRFLDETSRKSSAFNDNKYFPFYYYLGTLISCKNLLVIGAELGLPSACFAQGCKGIEYVAVEEKQEQFHEKRFVKKNIADHISRKGIIEFYQENLNGKSFDVILVNSKEIKTLDLDNAWNLLNENGFLVMDYLDRYDGLKKVFLDFAKVRNRDAEIIKTRYSVGIIQK